MIAQALSKPIVDINVTIYPGNAAMGRILPAVKLGGILRAQAQRSVIALPIPILRGPDAPAAVGKARVDQDVFEPAGARVDARSITGSSDRIAECLCNRRVIGAFDAVVFKVKIYR